MVAGTDQIATQQIQQVALNGAQVNAALGIVQQVSAKTISYQAGINMLQIMFGMTAEQAAQVLV